jgi:hypothetical protein
MRPTEAVRGRRAAPANYVHSIERLNAMFTVRNNCKFQAFLRG